MGNREPISHAALRYGGQAVLEGVMIRGPAGIAVAVRAPDGRIVLRSMSLPPRRKWQRWPFIRGMFILWETLRWGMEALWFSATVVAGENEAREVRESPVAMLTIAASLALALGIFLLLPALLAEGIERMLRLSAWIRTGLEGLFRLGLVLGYLVAVGRHPEIRRVFAYHGAEHKAVHALEAGVPLTIEGARPFPTAHPRCGTAFLLTVILVAAILFAFLPASTLIERLALRLALLPVLAALSYEALWLSARYQHVGLVAALSAPNLWLQRLTTREPDDSMLEVALAALEAARSLESSPQSSRHARPFS
ncbi:DUF1385 domain-containing protein [Thermoflexus sp.]|uniref:DUF1385 domain-containing protein n=1 Tax=Thermoflexus sp. TaxID=1969742 RepID=UPI001765328B|nr:DUF1385 domain-containing protein [Thermoflexus sp.]